MYILNWKPESHLLEASLGGRLTSGEAECFLDEISEILRSNETAGIEVVLDFAAVSSMDANVSEVLNSVRDVAHFAGAKVVTFVTRDDDEMTQFTNDRLQQVLEESLARLDEREAQILRMRFGLGGGEARPLRAIAAEWRMSPEGVRQISERAMTHLRAMTSVRDLSVYLEE